VSVRRGAPVRISAEGGPGLPILRERKAEPATIVIFGSTGDLARRKLGPALRSLHRQKLLPKGTRVLAFSRRATDLRLFPRGAGAIRGTFDDAEGYAELGRRLKNGNRVFYLAVPPSETPAIVRRLADAKLLDPSGAWARVVVEKPFGRDLDSARELNRTLLDAMDERQIFRIDHYLGKETVQNILVFRFGNAIFEPVWNRHHIERVEIEAAESIGIEGRGGFYEQTGVVRDMVQNHLLQVLSLVAMEPPVSFAADDVRDEKVQVLRSLRPVEPDDVVLGQYRGYRSEPGVSRRSKTPTFAAMRFQIDNWRWQGVPFVVRTGKCLARRVTEVAVHFRSIPLCLFGRGEICDRIDPNVLRIRIQPDEGIALRFACKTPGEDLAAGSVLMDFRYAEAFDRKPTDAYERLLLDVLRGDATLFARNDDVERAWEVLAPAIGEGIPVHPYARGGPGPAEAGAMFKRGAP